MTTRDFQIEFERRYNELYSPSKDFEKPTSDIIFSFINEYQQRFAKDLAIQLESEDITSEAYDRILRILTNLIVSRTDTLQLVTGEGGIRKWQTAVPADCIQFHSGDLIITLTYKGLPGLMNSLPVIQLSEDSDLYSSTPFNVPIIRAPFLSFSGNNINITTDVYTTLNYTDNFKWKYIKMPNNINVLGQYKDNVCSFPEAFHMDIVAGAFNMFVNTYKVGRSREPNKTEQ